MNSKLQRSTLAWALALPGMIAAGPLAAADWQGWTKMQQQVASVDSLLRGQVSNGLNPFADVSNFVLSPTGDKIQYVMYEAPYPYQLYGAQSGFVAYKDVNLAVGGNWTPNVIVATHGKLHGPDELDLTGAQARDRLWSRLETKRVTFPSGATRAIDDLLIDRKTGDVKAWVVERKDDAVFASDRLAIPADTISIKQGKVSTSMTLDAVQQHQPYDPAFL